MEPVLYIAETINNVNLVCFTEDCLKYIRSHKETPEGIEVNIDTIKLFDGNIEDCGLLIECNDEININLRIYGYEEQVISVMKSNSLNVIRKYVSRKYNVKREHVHVFFNKTEVEYKKSFEHYDIENGIYLDIHIKVPTVKSFIMDLIMVNRDEIKKLVYDQMSQETVNKLNIGVGR